MTVLSLGLLNQVLLGKHQKEMTFLPSDTGALLLEQKLLIFHWSQHHILAGEKWLVTHSLLQAGPPQMFLPVAGIPSPKFFYLLGVILHYVWICLAEPITNK